MGKLDYSLLGICSIKFDFPLQSLINAIVVL